MSTTPAAASPAPDAATPALPSVLPPASASFTKKSLLVFLNALACYLLTYQACAFAFQYVTVKWAISERVLGRWTVGGVRFGIADNDWHYNAVLNVYAVGPLLMLLTGIVAFVLFWKWLRFRRGLAKLLVLWTCFHATNYVLGGLLADGITQSGSAYVPSWIFGTGMSVSLALGVFTGVGQLALGFSLSLPFLLAQESRTLLQFDNRPLLIRYTVVGPWLVGSALLALSRWPLLTTNEVLHYGTMGLLLLPMTIGLSQQTLSATPVKPRATHLYWGVVLLAVAALVAWRVVLGGTGLRF